MATAMTHLRMFLKGEDLALQLGTGGFMPKTCPFVTSDPEAPSKLTR